MLPQQHTVSTCNLVAMRLRNIHTRRHLTNSAAALCRCPHAACRTPTLLPAVPAVVLNVDNTCPNNLLNKENVKFLFQAQPKGLVTLDFKQNGDYYISCAVS